MSQKSLFIMEFIETIILAYLVCSPIILMGIESEYFFLSRIPNIFLLIDLCFSSHPYKKFKRIAKNSFYGRYYEFSYVSGMDEDWYRRRINLGYSRKIAHRTTLVLANRILEVKIWLSIRSCQNYDQLFAQAHKLLQGIDSSQVIFVSSPLYSHPSGIEKGVRELRSAIVDVAENNKGLVFNQIPFLNHYIPRLVKCETKSKFEAFYQPIISSPYITGIVMNKGWEYSMGCRTEYETASSCNKTVEYRFKKEKSLRI